VGRDPALLKRLGVNLVDGMLPGGMSRDGSFNDDQYNRGQGAYLRGMGEAGFPVDCMYGIGLPRWLIDAGLACRGYGNGCDYVIDDPRAAEYRAKVLDHFIPLNSAERSFFAVDLANEPAFQGPSELMVENWRKWLKRKYGTLDNLNRVWGTHLESFEAIHRYPSRPEKMNGPWDRGRVDFGQQGIAACQLLGAALPVFGRVPDPLVGVLVTKGIQAALDPLQFDQQMLFGGQHVEQFVHASPAHQAELPLSQIVQVEQAVVLAPDQIAEQIGRKRHGGPSF